MFFENKQQFLIALKQKGDCRLMCYAESSITHQTEIIFLLYYDGKPFSSLHFLRKLKKIHQARFLEKCQDVLRHG